MSKLRPWLKAVVALGASIVLAGLASRHSREASLREWLRENPPGVVVWTHALATRWLAPCREPQALHRALRTLPANVDALQEVWCADQCRWVAVAVSSEELTLFSRNCAGRPGPWEPSGQGWAAFPGVMAAIPPEAEKTRVLAGDPREIRY
jgi:hypothetical protein